MIRPRVFTEEEFQILLANRDKGMGGVDGHAKLSSSGQDTVTGGVYTRRSRDVGSSPTRKRTQRLSGPSEPVSSPAPSPFSPLTLGLTGQLVSGKNQVQLRWHNGKVHKYPNKTFIIWRAVSLVKILDQGRPVKPIAVPVTLTCNYWPGDLRTRDVSGMLDALFHLLVYAKVLKDDGLIWNVWWRRHELNRKFPKVVMEISSW